MKANEESSHLNRDAVFIADYVLDGIRSLLGKSEDLYNFKRDASLRASSCRIRLCDPGRSNRWGFSTRFIHET